MSIPFRLNLFKQIEIYQDLEEIDKKFQEQLISSEVKNGFCENPPLWFFEKKILYWVYTKHKHLGSPILISQFTSKEITYQYIHETDFDKMVRDFNKSWSIKEKNLEYINATKEEIQNIQIRKAFGNLVTKGLAKFFKKNKNINNDINQENCDGIIITERGLEYAKMIYWLYRFKKANRNYNKIKGVKRVLELKNWSIIKYTTIITIAWLIIIGSVFIFFKVLIYEIVEFVLTIKGPSM